MVRTGAAIAKGTSHPRRYAPTLIGNKAHLSSYSLMLLYAPTLIGNKAHLSSYSLMLLYAPTLIGNKAHLSSYSLMLLLLLFFFSSYPSEEQNQCIFYVSYFRIHSILRMKVGDLLEETAFVFKWPAECFKDMVVIRVSGPQRECRVEMAR